MRIGALTLSRDLLALGGVLAVAGALNAWALADNGYGNVYYAAAVRSMTFSWKNFFFGAFDPAGYITVDKPPVFLWFGALLGADLRVLAVVDPAAERRRGDGERRAAVGDRAAATSGCWRRRSRRWCWR